MPEWGRKGWALAVSRGAGRCADSAISAAGTPRLRWGLGQRTRTAGTPGLLDPEFGRVPRDAGGRRGQDRHMSDGEGETRMLKDGPLEAEGAPSPATAGSGGLAAQTAERRAKRDALRARGINPYPTRFDRSGSLAELHRTHAELGPDSRTGETVQVAGRVLSIRGHGKLRFLTMEDTSGSIQLMFQADHLTEDVAAVESLVDVGDWIGATGELITSRRGELSVDVSDLQVLSKALRPLPDKWHGVSEAETRYRQREVDLLANKDSRRVFQIRFKTLSILRERLEAQGFLEVETPILQPQAGGAIARPFFTHANALDTEFSLRIAPELYLKRLVVGGFERVFEIARNFRNEGIDTRHSPEFTSLEAYRAFGDFTDGMDLTEHLIVEAAQGAAGRLDFEIAGQHIDLSPSLASPGPARPARGAPGQTGPSVNARRGAPGDVRRPGGAVSARLGVREAGVRALRQGAHEQNGRSGLHLPLPDRGVAAGPPQRV